jgi:repressor LexA
MKQNRASKKQQELLSFVDGFIKGNGYGPSYREIMKALGYKSVSTVAIHIDGLIAKGYLRRSDKSARSLEIVTLRDAPVSKKDDIVSLEAELSRLIKTKNLSSDEQKTVQTAMGILGLMRDVERNEMNVDEETK